MKNLVFIFTVVLMTALAFPSSAQKEAKQKKGVKSACYKSSMHCDACEQTLFDHLRFEKGVKEIELDHVTNTVKVVYDEKKSSGETLAKSIEKKGYKAEPITEEAYDKLVKDAVKAPAAQEQNKH